MSGKAIILELLAAGAEVVALVDPDAVPSRISGDVLAEGVDLPAYRVEKISSRDLQVLSSTTRHVTQRIRVTCLGRNVGEADALLRAARKACADRTGTIAGFAGAAVLTFGEGPEGFDPVLNCRAEIQDFRVSYNEPR